MLLLVASLGLTSCGDDEYTDTKVTNYVSFDLTKGENYAIPVGTAYQEPGFKATEGTEDVSAKVSVDGTVDKDKVGYYPISYSAVNKEGYSSSVTRNVFVYDPTITTDISGEYTTQPGTQRDYSGNITAFSGQKVKLEQMAPGIFSITDYMGGYYDQRAGYGASYAMHGYVALNADNTLTALYGHVDGWGDSYDSFSGSYDPATKTVKLSVGYAGVMTFNLILK